jgi:PAS domain S-box-containing protein
LASDVDIPLGVKPHYAPFQGTGGELGALIASRDWSDSPIGPPDQWPQSLKTTVGLILPAQAQIVLFWGPEFVALYNDAYAPTIGDKHPRALGRPARENWAELWDDLEPLLRGVRETGETFSAKDRPFYIERRGYGEEVYFDISYSAVPDESGAVGGVLCIVSETTDRVLAERAVRESEARFREQFENANDFIFTADLQMRIATCNPSVARALGHSPETLIGRSIAEFVPPEIWEKNKAMLAAKLSGAETTTRYEVEVNGPDGERMIWEINSRLTRDAAGEANGLHAIARDVTARRRAENELSESEARLRALTDHLPGGMVYQIATSKDGLDRRFLYVSQSFEALTGIPADKVREDPLFPYKLIHPDDRERLAAAEMEAIQTSSNFDVQARFCRSDGEIRWCRIISAPREQADGSLIWDGIQIDITEQHEAEAALRESETQLRLVTESLPVLISYVDAECRYRFANRAYQAWFGLPREQVLGKTMMEVLGDKAFDQVRSAVEAALAGKRQAFERELPYRYGKRRHVHVDYMPDIAPDGRVTGFYALVNDVSDAKSASEALRASEERYRSLFNAIEAGFCIVEMIFDGDDRPVDYRFVEANPAFERQTGLVGAVGRTAREMVPDLEDHWFELYGRVALSGEAARFDSGSDAMGRWFDVYAFRTSHPSNRRVAILFTDISDRRRAEQRLRELNDTLEQRVQERTLELMQAQEALRQSQKLEAMGQLTGGVAHDFNNLLTPIIGSLDLLHRRGSGGEREQRLIDGALQSAERAKTLVQRLLAFARRQPLRPTAVDVGGLIRGMADLVASTSGPQIKVVVDVAPDLPPAMADPNQLEMAILNLSVNARDAMPDGGTLTISALHEAVGTGHRSKLRSGDYVRLSVADTGTGMDEETLARAIEPFFSTKGIGKGTGLGLSMVHGLASQLGGALTVSSKRGLGTNVEFWLPVSEAAPEAAEAGEIEARKADGAGTALLVDDEVLVRMSTADMLIDLGYQVVEAGSGEEALRLIDEGLRANLLVTDHLMPGMTGADLARLVRERRPNLPVLVVSGYAEAEAIAPDLPRLAKPFRQGELAARLEEIARADN